MPFLVLVADIIGVFGGYLVGGLQAQLQPGHLSDADPALSRNDGRRFRSGQSGGVRLYRRADGLLSRLSFARRRRGRRSGDDAGRGVGLDPDPAVQLFADAGVFLGVHERWRAPKIAISGLRKSFGRKTVLDGVDIACGAGESLVIIGGSGTGKSVLIKCIIGLLDPDAGSIRIDGVETVGLAPRRPRPADAQIRHAVPGQRAVRFAERLGECRVRADPGARHGADAGARHRAAEACRGRARPRCRRCCGRPNCRAACRSAWRWRGRSRPSRKSCFSTSRRPGSIRSWPT